MLDPLKKTFLASLGVVAFTKEKLDGLVEELVEKGTLTQEQGTAVLKALLARGDAEGRHVLDKLVREIERLLGRGPFATRRDVRSLEDRLESLEEFIRARAADSES